MAGVRVVVSADALISADSGLVRAVSPQGRTMWTYPLPAGVVTLRPWGDAVLVTNSRTAWLLRDHDGSLLFTVPIADQELAAATAAGQRSPAPEISSVAIDGTRAYFGLGTAVVALDTAGKVVWRVGPSPRTSRAPVGAPLAAQGKWLFTHDSLSGSGLPDASSVRVAVRDTDDAGQRQWFQDYLPPPFTPPAGPPPGGGPVVGSLVSSTGPDGPGDGDPPLGGLDEAWTRVEARVGASVVVVRDASQIHAFDPTSGHQLWVQTSNTPVTSIALIGDEVLVASSKITAYQASTGVERWHVEIRGARMVATQDGKGVVVATMREVTAIDVSGAILWHNALPTAYGNAILDQITVGTDAVYLLLKPAGQDAQPLPADVIAISLV